MLRYLLLVGLVGCSGAVLDPGAFQKSNQADAPLTEADGVNTSLGERLGDVCDPAAHFLQTCNGHPVGVPAYCWHDPGVPSLVGQCVAVCTDEVDCAALGGQCLRLIGDELTCVKR